MSDAVCSFCNKAASSEHADLTLTFGSAAICSWCIENAAVQLVARRAASYRRRQRLAKKAEEHASGAVAAEPRVATPPHNQESTP